MARKKTTRKKAARKKTARKRATKKKAGLTEAGTEPAVNEIESEEIDTWRFCRSRLNKYIERRTKFGAFRAGKLKQLRFHANSMRGPALQAELEIFSEKLDLYLLGMGYGSKLGARKAVMKAASKSSSTMQSFLDVVVDYYLEA